MPYLSWDERRRRIVDAAIEVIAEEGFARTTTRRIAERADAPLGALHYCFRNKDELLQLIAEKGAEMLAEAFVHVEPSRGVEATIRDSISDFWDWYRDNIGLVLALTELGMVRIRRGGNPKKIYAMYGPFGHDLLTEYLEQAVEAEGAELAVPIEEIVRFILHRFDGLTIEYAASKDPVACKRQVDLLADAIVAIAVKPTQSTKGNGSRTRRKARS